MPCSGSLALHGVNPNKKKKKKIMDAESVQKLLKTLQPQMVY